ncbi:major facilitator superfamily domain-containing protein [Lentinula guzmanii]|uniref:Major facilitator superfamily domain-containing protein n=1 Tax=Lentinula guzmanii TaxID=2804957 RepID=A0AA38MZV9_9AGAR|nr:major facilitator superfamily domain-containing protein [Lentinula guzmanii]
MKPHDTTSIISTPVPDWNVCLDAQKSSEEKDTTITRPGLTESKSCISQTTPSDGLVIPISKVEVEYDDCFTEGGARTWLIVFGLFMAKLALGGLANSWGVFQAYYEQTLLKNVLAADIAWIGSIQRNIGLILGSLVGWFFDLGYFRVMLHSCSILLVLATLLTAQCHQYWQFLLCQGVLTGISESVILVTLYPVATQWFKLHREFAIGLMLNGSALGGVIFPSVFKALIPRIGFQWSMRVMALILFVMLFTSSMIVKERRPRRLGATSASIFFALGTYTLNTYLAASAEEIGVPQALAFYLVATTNAAMLIGNTVLGPLADCTGPLNVFISATPMLAMVNFAWPFARTIPSLFTIAALSGFASAGSINICIRVVLQMGPSEHTATLVGNLQTIIGTVQIISPTIAGIINENYGLKAMAFSSGGVLLACSALAVVSRQLLIGKRWFSFSERA